jgi:hypothetical protein
MVQGFELSRVIQWSSAATRDASGPSARFGPVGFDMVRLLVRLGFATPPQVGITVLHYLAEPEVLFLQSRPKVRENKERTLFQPRERREL